MTPVHAGSPVEGSSRWWAKPLSLRQMRVATPLVATAPDGHLEVERRLLPQWMLDAARTWHRAVRRRPACRRRRPRRAARSRPVAATRDRRQAPSRCHRCRSGPPVGADQAALEIDEDLAPPRVRRGLAGRRGGATASASAEGLPTPSPPRRRVTDALDLPHQRRVDQPPCRLGGVLGSARIASASSADTARSGAGSALSALSSLSGSKRVSPRARFAGTPRRRSPRTPAPAGRDRAAGRPAGAPATRTARRSARAHRGHHPSGMMIAVDRAVPVSPTDGRRRRDRWLAPASGPPARRERETPTRARPIPEDDHRCDRHDGRGAP